MEAARTGKELQGFAPRKIVTITADEEYTFAGSDEAFRVPTAVNYYNSSTGSGHEAALVAGSITVLVKGLTYTFDATMEVEVM